MGHLWQSDKIGVARVVGDAEEFLIFFVGTEFLSLTDDDVVRRGTEAVDGYGKADEKKGREEQGGQQETIFA